MARTFTAGQRTAISGATQDIWATLELKDYDGTWKDVSTGIGGGTPDFLNEVLLEEDIDTNTQIMTATLLRDDGSTKSLAPLRTDSTINRDSLGNYQPFLDLARQWRAKVAVVTHGVAPIAGDYKEIGAGTYDIINVDSPTPTVQIQGRDYGATLLDKWIEVKRKYGDDTVPVAMETVLQAMLDDNLGVGVIALYTPSSPSFLMNAWEQQPMSLMQAVNEVAQKAGFVCRYRYDASDVQRLTLYQPSRSAAAGSEVWTLGPSEYLSLPVARLDLAGVRNRIVVRYLSASTGKVETVTSTDATSIARYGGPAVIPRTLEVDLSKDTNITTSVRAQALADLIKSDLAVPPMEQQFETPGFWIAQLGDYGKFTQNGVHYDTDQYGGVTHIQHRIANGTMHTTLSVRGQPSSRYRTWVQDRGPYWIIGQPKLSIVNFRETARTSTDVTYSWRNEGQPGQLWLWLTSYDQPIPSDPWPLLSSEPTYRLTNTTTTYTVPIPDFGKTTYLQLVPVDDYAQTGNPWRGVLQGTFADIPQGTIAIDASGIPTPTIDGPDWVASYKYATSTSAQPDDTAVLAGTTINGRQFTMSGSALAIGASFYISAIPYSQTGATGVQGPSIRLKATRHDFSATKTAYVSVYSLRSKDSASANQPVVSADGGVHLLAGTGITPYGNTVCVLTIPSGVTLTAIAADILAASGDPLHDATVTIELFRLKVDGTAPTSLGSATATGGGYQNKTFSFSESTTGRSYQFACTMTTMPTSVPGSANLDAAIYDFSYTYTMGTSDKAI